MLVADLREANLNRPLVQSFNLINVVVRAIILIVNVVCNADTRTERLANRTASTTFGRGSVVGFSAATAACLALSIAHVDSIQNHSYMCLCRKGFYQDHQNYASRQQLCHEKAQQRQVV